MLQRVITSFVSLAVFFAVIFLGEKVFCAAVAVLIAGMLYELYKAARVGKILCAVGAVSAAVIGAGFLLNTVSAGMILSMMLFLGTGVFLHGKKDFKTVYSAAFMTFYVMLFMGTLVALRLKYGVFMVIPVFLFAWMTDVGAYFGGYFFGKHKLIPTVSPKKTVEGAVGGVISAVASGLLYCFILKNGFNTVSPGYFQFAVMALAGSVLSQLGDLVASAVKRDCGIKDFGTIFPGHGGILDRFDSVIFIVPVVYFFIDKFVMIN